jgi:HlyD family secretion protein
MSQHDHQAPLNPPSDALPIVLPALTKPTRRPPQRGLKFGRWISRLVLLLGLVALSVGSWKYGRPLLVGSGSSTKPLTVRVVKGELKVVVTDRGEMESVNSVNVTCELQGGGKLVSIVDEGKRVKKGDEVAKLDIDALTKQLNEQDVKWQAADNKVKGSKSELSQAKNKRESEVSKADLALTLAKIDLRAYDDPKGEYVKDFDKLQGMLENNRRQLKEAEDDLSFSRGMVKDGYTPLEQLRAKERSVKQREFEVTSAEAEVYVLKTFTREKKLTELKAKAAEADLELARTKESQQSLVDKAEAEVKASQSTEAIEKSQLDRVRSQIDRCTILAPGDGIVVYSNQRYWDESSRIRPGAQLYYRQEIFTLPDLSSMKVKLKIHESVIKKVRVGMPVMMMVDALPNRPLNGKVVKIATIAQSDGWRGAGVKQYETEVSIDDLPTEAGLKPGMTADVKILVNVIPDAVIVPVSAVAEYEGKRVVYVWTSSGALRREVTVGDSSEQYIQILGGDLAEGEEVALDARTRAAADLKASGAVKKE